LGLIQIDPAPAAETAGGNPLPLEAFSAPKPSPSEAAAPVSAEGAPSSGRLFVHDVALTMVAEAAAMGSSLLLTALLSRWMGARPLSEYLLLRRVLSWTVAATVLGMATGLPRYVAHCAGGSKRSGAVYFVAALACMVPMALLIGGIMVLNRTLFARWFFGDATETGLVTALALLIVGFSIHRAVYGYYRGLLDMTRANVLELTNAALLPLFVVAALAHSQTVAVMMGITGVLMTISAALFAVPVFKRLRGTPLELRAHCRELLAYGVPRVPGEFGSAAITAIGPMLAVHFIKITKVSPLLLGLNMLLVVGYAAGPVGVVLLSKVSMMLGRNEHEAVQSRLRLLIAGVTELSVFACIQLAIFADVVVRAWVGPGFEDQMGVIRMVLLAIPFYLFFVTLRSTIDAATVKPFNTANVMVSLAVYVGLIALWMAIFPLPTLLVGIAVSLLVSQMLLALLTARTFRRFYGLGIPWRRLGPSFVAALALGGAAFAFRSWQSGPMPVAQALVAELVLATVYVAVLARLGSGWLAYTWHVGVRRQASWPAPAPGPGGVK
jgi:O-antigen/teichoic acid export membrane protein